MLAAVVHERTAYVADHLQYAKTEGEVIQKLEV